MKTLWLCSSALHTRHGVFSAEKRLEQTVSTLESIKAVDPSARILIIESGAEAGITTEESDKLKPYIEGLLNFNPDVQVQEIYKMADTNWDVAKNLTELVVFGKALDFIIRQQPELLEGIDRVFKISGRYRLNENFDISKHLDPKMNESYIFATRRVSQFPAIVTDGLTHQFFSRLWSWPTQKTALVFFRYNLMIEDFVGTMAQKKYRDIEHLLFRYFSGPFSVELPNIGIQGELGPNGVLVKD
jgi:hypothetical protein